ncbi:hypothetical protein Y032_0323g2484 [Ancylostoma ceylanicum]|uniref:Uncharacterized protein n=1 Tax=Ancylostoma ceylanicum TaxID=53326 RepID=A0A016S0C8_9BILA|nr:hypothetical protein Y032_0323g2484 [Ancylostoma ceylanicum]
MHIHTSLDPFYFRLPALPIFRPFLGLPTSEFRVIFGSGDHYRAVTATANKHFVSSAYHQYFRVFLSM